MVGHYHSKLDDYTKAWVLANYGKVTDTYSPSVHIDDLLGVKRIDPQETVELSLVGFQIIVAEIKKLKVPIQPCLVITLEIYSDQLQCLVPRSKAEMIEQLYITPPDFYLLSWMKPKQYQIIEEYRKHLPFDLIKADDIYSFYCEYRKHDKEGVGEFNRDVYVEYYPEGLVPRPW